MYLNCHSVFSFRYGTLKATELLDLAKQHAYSALALTDINNTSACLNFVREAKHRDIKPLIGIDFRNGVDQQFIGIAKNNKGFLELNNYLSDFLHNETPIPERAQQMKQAWIIYPFSKWKNDFFRLRKNEFIGIEVEELKQLAFSPWRSHQKKFVLKQPVSVQDKRAYNIHRLLRAIGNNTLLSKLPESELCLPSHRLLPKRVLYEHLQEFPQIIENTLEIINSSEIDFEYKGNQKSGAVNHNKNCFTKSKGEDKALLRQLCEKNLSYRYPDSEQQKAVRPRLEKELKTIQEQGFDAYFLINWDMLRFAREQGFFYVGRGSGANSVVAYLLRITDVDPVKLDLYFERFINPYRENPPDFDIDFSWKDRDAVTDYLFEKYGPTNQIALLATYNTFTHRSLMRELGKVFGLPKSEIDVLAGDKKRVGEPDQYTSLIYKYAQYMDGMPSHLSIHAGGVLISEKPIHYYSATSMPPKGYPTVQFDMIHAEDAGLYKYDVLSQRGLGKIKDALDLVKSRGKALSLDIHHTEPFMVDAKINALLSNGDAMGCFYIESPAMRMLLKKLDVDNYLGLVAASSIIRPGVAKSGMMREYILRSRNMAKDWEKKTPKVMLDIMEETYGVMVYQEDVIKVAHYFAGLDLGEADVLRRGMSGKFRSRAEFAKVKQKFFDNCKLKGYSDQLTAEVWRQTESFAGYAFSKGHSASYAIESYQSLYLKAYHPMEFIVGVINNGGGFYSRELYFHEAQKLGAKVEAPCVNHSSHLSQLYGKNVIYMGFHMVRDLESRTIDEILAERGKEGDFTDLHDFVERCAISLEQLSLLIRVHAFRFTAKSKAELLWEMYKLLGHRKKTTPAQQLFRVQRPSYRLPSLDVHLYEDAYDEMELLGFPLCSPFDLLKGQAYSKTLASQLISQLGRAVNIVGYLVTVKNTKTSNGKLMQFGTFLDHQGDWIDTVHFPPVVGVFPFRGKGCYSITGKVVEEFGYATIEVSSMERLEYVDRDDNHVPQKRPLRKSKVSK